ncbi:hypothetical protein GW17_00010400 [Ensete ventricosum]|nr:hypothetical protein GW17_00010400 [Ensete ventricosum]
MDDGEIPATSRASSEPSASGGGVVDGVEGPAVRHEGCDALARAIASTLGAMMREFDSRAEGTVRSQDELSLSLDRLTGESSMAMWITWGYTQAYGGGGGRLTMARPCSRRRAHGPQPSGSDPIACGTNHYVKPAFRRTIAQRGRLR